MNYQQRERLFLFLVSLSVFIKINTAACEIIVGVLSVIGGILFIYAKSDSEKTAPETKGGT